MKQLFYIKPAEDDQIAGQVLSMRIGPKHCSFAITAGEGNELYSLGYYSASEINSETLGTIYAQHAELHHSFSVIQLCYDHPESVLVPLEYNADDKGKTLLHTMYGSNGNSLIVSEPVDEWKLNNVYAVPANIREWVDRVFPGYWHRHHYTIALKMMPSDSADHLLIDFTPEEFSFVVLKENKILIAQTLTYTTPEDILYYLLKACNQFSLSRGEVQLFISGMIEKESQLYRELYLYFLNVSFREPAWKLPEGSDNDYPAHFFTSLNDLARCAS